MYSGPHCCTGVPFALAKIMTGGTQSPHCVRAFEARREVLRGQAISLPGKKTSLTRACERWVVSKRCLEESCNLLTFTLNCGTSTVCVRVYPVHSTRVLEDYPYRVYFSTAVSYRFCVLYIRFREAEWDNYLRHGPRGHAEYHHGFETLHRRRCSDAVLNPDLEFGYSRS